MTVADFYDLFKKQEQKRPPATVTTLPVDPSRATSYAAAALRREAEIVATTGHGSRNQTLNKAYFNMGRHVGAGSIDLDTVRNTLAAAARQCGLPDHEIETVLREGSTSAARAGQEVPRHPTALPDVPAVTVLDLSKEEAGDFWDARELLSHVHAYSTARRVSPWAVLGVVLTRAVTATPYFVALPPIVGGVASLNLFVGLVGRSGSGKGAAESVAAECFDVGHITTHKTGSGEGIAHGYRKRTKDEVVWLDDAHAVLFSVPEIDTLSALGGRQGATLMPELRSAWSGENLGFGYADPAKRLPVPAHEYRLCLVAGIQPGRAQALLEDADGGTPQRFLWLPAVDPDAPDVPPPCPAPKVWTAPDTRPSSPFRSPSHANRLLMTACREAVDIIDQARLARLRGTGEALDGHGLLTRLKVAAALALTEGRLDITEGDWDLSGVIHRKSDATRAGVQRALEAANAERNEARAFAEAKRSLVVAEQVEDAAIKRVSRRLLRKLKEAGQTPAGELRKVLASRDRPLFDEAVERLIGAGVVVAEEGIHGLRYGLKEVVTDE